MSDLDADVPRFNADVLLPFFGLSRNRGPRVLQGRTSSGFTSRPVRPACRLLTMTCFDKLKPVLGGFAEAAAARAVLPLHRGEALHFECSTIKGIPAAS